MVTKFFSKRAPAIPMIETGYADKGHIMAVEFDRKIIIYWWIMANVTPFAWFLLFATFGGSLA